MNPKKHAADTRSSKKIAVPARQPAQGKPLDLSLLEKNIGYSLRSAHLSTFAGFNREMAPHEIRPSHFVVLLLIRSNPGVSQSAICQTLGFQKANFATLLHAFERRSLTERRKAEGDRRASALHLTPTGELFARKIEKAHQQHEDLLAARLGERKSRKLLRLLHEFAAAEHTG